MSKTRKMLIVATLAGLAAVLGIFENMLPVLTAIPGGKLGVANTVTVVALWLFGPLSAIAVSIVRVTVSCMLYGGMNAFMYSFAGAVVSTTAMICAKKLLCSRITPIGVSVLGAACHNTAQVAVAWIVLQSSALTWYLACLLLIALVSGTVCGWIARECIKRLGMI